MIFHCFTAFWDDDIMQRQFLPDFYIRPSHEPQWPSSSSSTFFICRLRFCRPVFSSFISFRQISKICWLPSLYHIPGDYVRITRAEFLLENVGTHNVARRGLLAHVLWLKTVLRLAAGMKLGWLKTLACIGVFVEWLGQAVSEKSALEAMRLHSQSFSCLCWHVSEKCQS